MSVILNPPILSRSRTEGQEVNRGRNNGPVQTQQTMARGSSLPTGCIISQRSLHVSLSAFPPSLFLSIPLSLFSVSPGPRSDSTRQYPRLLDSHLYRFARLIAISLGAIYVLKSLVRRLIK